MNSKLKQKALKAIQEKGALLVYPINNKKEPDSIWNSLFPRSEMRWEWDVDGDQRVSDLWFFKEEYSRSKEVVYSKWYQNRATFFSTDVFINLMAFLKSEKSLSKDSQNILDLLEQDSPLSTKQIKEAADLQGKFLESTYNRAMKPLWLKMLIVGFGEFEDSSFPSLAVGASKVIFEDLYTQAQDIQFQQAEKYLENKLGQTNLFYQFAKKIKKLEEKL